MHIDDTGLMTTLSPIAGESPLSAHADLEYYDDDEPDEEWKAYQKEVIAASFQPMIQEAKARTEHMIRSVRGLEGEEAMKDFYINELKGQKAEMKLLAKEEFECALKRERLQRRLRRDIPMAPVDGNGDFEESMRLDIGQDQGGTHTPGSLLDHDDHGEAAFNTLIDLSDPGLLPPVEDEDLKRTAERVATPGPGALKITRLPAEPNVNGEHVWVKASDAAARHREQLLAQWNAAHAPPQITGPPPEPPKKWVSASEMASRQKRIMG